MLTDSPAIVRSPCVKEAMDFCVSDLHQRAGPQRRHCGEGEQPLHGGHRSGDPGCSGCRGGAGFCGHETLTEEEER